MLKVKHLRTADCVVAGYRVHKDGEGVGSLLLGLYDDDGVLHHVGVASSFTADAAQGAARRARAATATARSTTIRGASGPRPTPSRRSGQRMPGGAEPVEHRQGPQLGAAAHRAGRRGRATSTCRATASATPPASCAGAPTASRRRAPTTSSTSPVPIELQAIFQI